MAFLYTRDESKPAGGRARSLGDDDIREHKKAERERLAVDHDFRADTEAGAEETQTPDGTIGYHKKVTLTVRSSDPTEVADAGIVYTKDVSDVAELHFIDENAAVTQITSGGALNLADALLTNNAYLKAKNAAGDGNVDLIKANVNDVAVVPSGSQTTTNAAPSADKDLANKKYVDDQLAALDWTDHGKMGYGTAAHGATIPLPSGYTSAKCGWMVSMEDSAANADSDTCRKRFYCSVNSSRVITARTIGDDQSKNADANYFILGIK